MPGALHNLYIFDRRGACLFYKEWQRPRNPLSDSPDEDKKLMFGLLFSLKQLVAKMSPVPEKDGLHSFRTKSYTLHLYETPTGYRFVLLSTPDTGDLRPALVQLYATIFVEHVVRNPLHKMGDPIESIGFERALDAFVEPLLPSRGAAGAGGGSLRR